MEADESPLSSTPQCRALRQLDGGSRGAEILEDTRIQAGSVQQRYQC